MSDRPLQALTMWFWVIAVSAAWFAATTWLVQTFGWVNGLAGGVLAIILVAYGLVELISDPDED